MTQFETLLNQVYAAWLGKLIGIRLGAPVENWTYEQIRDTYGKLNGYPVDYGVFASDDDANGPLFFVRALERYGKDVTAEQMGETLLSVASIGHGFFWWGGIGVSTEDTAYHNLLKGIKAPASGSAEVNGKTMAEQIGGQIFSDCWGYVSAGNVDVAVDLAAKMSSVTHGDDGIEGGKFVAACIALAFSETDARTVIDKALMYLNPESDYVACVKDVLSMKDAGMSMEECRAVIFDKYSYANYPGVCHIIPNTAIMIMSMVYGENDFSKTLTMLCECGWDTDCTCGNVGSMMGALVGVEGIDEKWVTPIQDILISSSAMGSLNLDTVSETALYFASLAAQINGIEMDEKYRRILDAKETISFFDLPYGTQGFQSKEERYSSVQLKCDDAALKCIIGQGFPHKTGRIYKKTYFVPEDVYDARYQPSMSPRLYPGETISFTLSNPRNLPFKMRIYAMDVKKNTYAGDWFVPSIEKVTYQYKIDCPKDVLLSEFGLELYYEQRIMHELFLIHEVSTDHVFDYEIVWKDQCMEDWGLDFGEVPWKEVRQCTTLKNNSVITDEGLLVENDGVMWSDLRAETVSFEAEFELSGTMDLMLWAEDFRHYHGLRISENEICFVKRNGENVQETPIFKSEMELKGKNALNFKVKNDLIEMEINQQYHIEMKRTLTEMKKGSFGVVCDENSRCLLFGCKLESI
ncbi:MAG: ADP-ribosylglycohydrolase family protein [Erysipelotrichaceae bacterium]|nr:ADP-ribosylglycohydrolase family protein [Erysipelotrichaceae bacterium]